MEVSVEVLKEVTVSSVEIKGSVTWSLSAQIRLECQFKHESGSNIVKEHWKRLKCQLICKWKKKLETLADVLVLKEVTCTCQLKECEMLVEVYALKAMKMSIKE